MKEKLENILINVGETSNINLRIGLAGKMASGKTTLAEWFEEMGYTRFSIGDAIKTLSNIIIENGHLEQFVKEVLKDKEKAQLAIKDYLILRETIYFENFIKNINGGYEKNDDYRNLTQEVGQIMRKYGGDSVWIKFSVDKAIKSGEKVICDDIRLKEEKEIFEQNGFTVIRLELEKSIQRKRVEELYGIIDEKRYINKTEVDLDNEQFECTIHTGHYNKEETFQKALEFLTQKPSILKDIVKYVDTVPLGVRDDWEKYFMTQAFLVGIRSTCGSRRVGTVIVKDNHIVASGYNGYPSGAKHCIDGGCPRFIAKQQGLIESGKYMDDYPCDAFHSEHNAINQLLKLGISSQGCVIYTTTFPCSACAKTILGAGIKKIYYCQGYPDKASKSYLDRYDVQVIKINI